MHVSTEQFLRKQHISLSEVVYIGPNYYPRDGYIDWIAIAGIGILTLMIFLSIYTIVHFAAKSYRLMSSLVSTSKNSDRYKSTQSQLLNALVLQALIPFVLMHLPASFVFIMPLFGCGEQIFARIFSVTVALYPVLDPLPTVFIVKCYRTAVLKYCSNFFCAFSSKSVGIVLEQPSSTAYHVPTVVA
ncbi:unnamed protein product [Caenorhabditis sp. 36 PRJEB53466]|nr:unnamed protein product [Caenorhabditis sp. 36 PRJEB53466]